MTLQFLRGAMQAPKGHVILFARSTHNPRVVYCTYCVVPPIPLSLAKYLPSFLAAQLPPEDLQEATSMNVVPIPPMLEEGKSLEHLESLAEHRDDDLCEIGSINPQDEAARMQRVVDACQEYGQLYFTYASTFEHTPGITAGKEEFVPLDDLDAEDLFIETMSDRQRLTELGKLIGMARYALDGRDQQQLAETSDKMQRIARHLADKYKIQDLIAAAADSSTRGSRLAQLYLERGFKLLDEEYAEIPRIEREIRELRDQH
ncbi:MAG TPA: hypothetical protein VNE61_06915 [Ktedonobacteraceae bacterium]|nr:hypothetical protein [Ktedonobacteraceae bacterium]